MVTASQLLKITNTRTLYFDITAFALITFLPAISHIVSVPLYLFEPMSILLILSIVHTSRKNSFIIAAALPIISYLLSSHPAFYKVILIATELALTVSLFSYINQRLKNMFVVTVATILISKVYYYIGKFLLIKLILIEGELVSTPLYIQGIVILVLSGYVYFIFNRRDSSLN